MKNKNQFNIVLVVPPCLGYDMLPLGAASLSAYMKGNGYLETSIIDWNIEYFHRIDSKYKKFWFQHSYLYKNSLKDHNFPDELEIKKCTENIQSKSPDIVGISLFSTTVDASIKLAKKLKSENPKIKIIFGGPECSPACTGPEKLLKTGVVDFVCVGEGERSFYELCESLRSGKSEFKGVYYKDSADCIIGNFSITVIDLDEIPPPDFSDFQLDLYDRPVFTYQTTRSCPYQCDFCDDRIVWRKFRTVSVSKVIKDLSYLVKNNDIKRIFFCDSIINITGERIRELANGIIKKQFMFEYYCQGRIGEFMDGYTFKLMYNSGCRIMTFGIETFSQRLLDRMEKNCKQETAVETIINCARSGIIPKVSLIIGHPYERWIDYFRTVVGIWKLKHYLNSSYIWYSECFISKHSSLREKLVKEGLNFTDGTHWKRWSNFNTYFIRRVRMKLFDYFMKFSFPGFDSSKNAFDEAKWSLNSEIEPEYIRYRLKYKEMLKLQKYPEAQQALKIAIRKNPFYMVLYFEMAALLVKTNKMPEAMSYIEKYISHVFVNPEAFILFGQILYSSGNLIRAKEKFLKSIELKKTAQAYKGLGMCADSNGEKSFEYYKESFELESDPDTGFLLALSYKKEGNMENFRNLLLDILEHDISGKINCELGYDRLSNGKTEEAGIYFKKAVLTKCPDFNTYYHLAEFLKLTGEYEKGIEFMNKALDVSPEEEKSRINEKLNDIVALCEKG
ncbi:cobalamin-dependent protein [bacterium]|nr:cobalamin-dependent protein [bacterium]